MMGLQALGQLPDRRPFTVFVSLHMKQQQVLQIGDAKFMRNVFTEAFKASQLMTELLKGFKFFFGECFFRHVRRR